MAEKKEDWLMWILGGGALLAILSIFGMKGGSQEDKEPDTAFSGNSGGGPSKPGCGPCSLGKL